ncbi:TonB-dependent receptor plug domain-containing protein [Rufibacter latericius]|uniref:TonB-dependent receptor plug domain-containing protein n=1 Tax=Rufibacter latericius TaxID=2487040 RepID=UPI001401EB02|nr:TonB-dependent receptor plug domain-containing protein [Rufibacter latericius]
MLLVLGGIFAFNSKKGRFDIGIKEIIAQFQRFGKAYPQEKVYLHLDKPYYAAGEDIWFKAYLVNASSHEPSLWSKVLYVDLVSAEDSIYKRVVVDMKNGMGHGDFALEDTIPDGQYRLRAYTSWMQNFDEAYFFHQNLQIFNPRVADLVPSVKFAFKRYGTGDSVYADVSLKNLREEPLAQRAVIFYAQAGKKVSGRHKGETNSQGNAHYRFYLPSGEARQNAQLWLSLKEGTEQVRRNFKIPPAAEKTDLQFFPEGGELVYNMWSTVGFKAVDVNGWGKEVQGSVYDGTGKKVVDFQSHKFGMGRFGFIPQPGKTYVAVLNNTGDTEVIYPLPAAREKGIVVSVDNSKPSNVQLKAYIVGYKSADSRPKSISVVAQSRGTVYFSAHAAAAKDVFLINIPKEKLPTGVVQFTLFSNAGEPLAERLVFSNRHDQLQLTLTPDKPDYKPREKVTMQLQAKTAEGTPVSGHFSVSVTDVQKVSPELNAANLLSNLLLTSDLRGYIEQPDYYFSSQEPEATLALDNLMLTQGWRRFAWKDLLQDKKMSLPFPVEQSLAVTGTVLKLFGKPEPGAIVTFLGYRTSHAFLIDTTDAEGKFSFGVMGLDDSSKVVVQARTAKGKSALEVRLDKGLPITAISPQVPYLPPALLSQTTLAYLRSNRDQLRLDQLAGKSILLSAVEIRAKKDQRLDELRRGGFYNQPDQTINASALPPSMDIISALQGRVAGMLVNGGNITMRGGGTSMAGGTPLFLLNGMPIDVDYIKTISLSEVEAIDILKPGASSAIYGSQGSNGVISVLLKKGDNTTPPDNTRYQGVAAYTGVHSQIAREFYMPHYDKPSEVELPDLRTTLFWSPTVVTDANGRASFSFFSSDSKTTYRAVVEGLTSGGQLGRTGAEMQVK